MAQSFISNKEQGFTLIELIVALALVNISGCCNTAIYWRAFIEPIAKVPMLKSRTAVFLVWNIWHVIYGF